MARREVLECDRCGETVPREDAVAAGWAHVELTSAAVERSWDLCPVCTLSLELGVEAVVVPA